MSTTLLAVVILAGAGVLVVAFLIWNSGRQRRAYEDVPPAMRPGYSDEQLERGVLERYMSWGVVLTLFFAVFFPVYLLNEQNRLQANTEGFFVSSVVRGENHYTQYCAECHGAELGGGGAASPYDPEESWPAPSLNNIVARYAENETIGDIHDYVYNTIERGRPGTPMPTWGAAFDGSLNDQEIEDITDFILANQIEETAEADPAADLSGEELFQANCARCHGDRAEGLVGPTLIGLFERHGRESVLGILRNGINLGNGLTMPPWQNGYMYPETHYSDEALDKIVDHLESIQPEEIPEDLLRYQGPGSQYPDAAEGAEGDDPSTDPGVDQDVETGDPADDETGGDAPTEAATDV